MLIGAVSPYHLTTREAALVAALVLADHVVTMMPAPAAGRSREDIGRAVEQSPSYLRLMESWRWSMPLWRSGVIGTIAEGARADRDVREARERIWREESLAALRGVMHEERQREDEEWLEGLSADILRAGPDPAFALAVAAGMDQFAAGHGLVSFRAQTASVAQRAEAKLSRRVFSMAMPVPRDASAERIEEWREEGAGEFATARGAIEAAFDASARRDEAETLSPAEAGRTITEALGEDDARFVAITGVTLPTDVVFRAGTAAVAAMGGGARRSAAAGEEDAGAGRFRAVIVKPLKARPA